MGEEIEEFEGDSPGLLAPLRGAGTPGDATGGIGRARPQPPATLLHPTGVNGGISVRETHGTVIAKGNPPVDRSETARHWQGQWHTNGEQTDGEHLRLTGRFFPLRAVKGVCIVLAVMLLAAVSCFAGETGTTESKKEKEKEAPFKCDAWCVFSDLTRERQYITPDPKSEHSRPNAQNLGGFGRRGRWANVVFDVKNTTDPKDKEVMDGTAEIKMEYARSNTQSGDSYKTDYVQNFQVAPQSEKQYHFSVFCPDEGWSPNIALTVKCNQRGTFTRSFELNDLDAQQKQLIVVVSDTPGAYKYLGPMRKMNMEDVLAANDKKQIEREVASVTPSELPARWHDLVLASLIIIDGPPKEGLTDEQWDAIKTYAMAGGKVLVMAGKDPARLKGAAEDLCGIVVKGTAELKQLDAWKEIAPFPAMIGPKKKGTGDRGQGSGDRGQESGNKAKAEDKDKGKADEKKDEDKEIMVPIVEVTAPGCGIVRRNTATQIVESCEKSYGAGRVAFLPYSLGDPMFKDWPGRQMIPLGFVQNEKNLFTFEEPSDDQDPTQQANYNPYGNSYNQNGRRYRGGYYQQNLQEQLSALQTFRNTLDTSFSQDTPVITQSPSMVAWFMAIYMACAIPLNYLIFALLRRREAAWLMAPLWAFGFTIGAYYIGYAGQTGVVTVNEVSVIELGPGQSDGVARTFMGVYTPRRNDYQIEFPPQAIGTGGLFDTEAVPTHLVNAEYLNRRIEDLPSMRIRDTGNSVRIDEILFQSRSTRRFEVQHRAWVNGGIELRYLSGGGDQDPTPRMKTTNNTGRMLHNPVFIKGNQYLELSVESGKTDFANGQSIDTTSVYTGWQPLNEHFFEKFASRFNTDGTRQHIADRARAVGLYLKNHMSQYAAGVLIAWADGASLPVKVGPTGGKTQDPNMEGITLFVVPAVATNRGWRAVQIEKMAPKVKYSVRYNPENDATTGEWIPLPKIGGIGFDPKIQNSVYLRLEFDPMCGQYLYEIPPKMAELKFDVRNSKRQPFSGELIVGVRDHAADPKKEPRFKVGKIDGSEVTDLTLGPNAMDKNKTMHFQFNDAENFTPPSTIVLKLSARATDGQDPRTVEGLVLENVEVKVVPRQ